jgi:hypothetical protein
VAVRHLELADGDTEPGAEVRLGSVLDDPAYGVQGLVISTRACCSGRPGLNENPLLAGRRALLGL